MRRTFSLLTSGLFLLFGVQPAALASTFATPTLGMGAGQVSVRLGSVNGQSGQFNTQFLFEGSVYSFTGQSGQAGTFTLNVANYSYDSNPHTLAIYNLTRPNSIGGTRVFLPSGTGPADRTFSPAGSQNIVSCWEVRFWNTNASSTDIAICSTTFGGAQAPTTPSSVAAPIKYSGPEFSGLSLKPALSGASATLEGRKLDQISSVTIGGKAAVLSNATDKSVNIGLPAGLDPGVYDLVVTTSNHGKLTHMNAIRIREELPATSLTIQGTGVLSGEEFKKLTAFARTQNPDMNTVTCIVNSGSEGKSFTQVRALCDRIAAANLNIKTTQFGARSTVKSSAVFARVVFSSVQ